MASEVLHQARVPSSQQGRESAPLVEQTGQPGSLPRLGQRRARAPVAKGPPGLLEASPRPQVRYKIVLPLQAADPKELAPKTSLAPLQDVVALQDPLMLGLISHLIDSPLQEHVEQATLPSASEGANHSGPEVRNENQRKYYEDQKTSPVPGAAPPNSAVSSVGWTNGWSVTVTSTDVTTPPWPCIWCWSPSPMPRA